MNFGFRKKSHYVPHKSTRYIHVKENNNRKLPKLYQNRENCCGCSACYSICPKHAIKMEPDEEGFLYPLIDAEKCVNCRKCISVCTFKIDQEKRDLF